ncbi:hypothetical protein CCAX7_54420 [Capsulimonas corticalis]|uniref:Uncharacterized protein n=1 Tax=Capsulimonas corticalis TaxID=2219043 RepID=A0A402D5W6_9BACT|nr:LamG-like jellyroll fold domain-containing protein [Capsulimonas corticalis]BDI33391.1 hypothetical protein CCAX7_54420 [Capsulimonas corticalis]
MALEIISRLGAQKPAYPNPELDPVKVKDYGIVGAWGFTEASGVPSDAVSGKVATMHNMLWKPSAKGSCPTNNGSAWVDTNLSNLPTAAGTILWSVYPNFVYNDGNTHTFWSWSTSNNELTAHKFGASSIIDVGWNSSAGGDDRVHIAASNALITPNLWQDYAFTWSPAGSFFYRNGVLIASTTTPPVAVAPASTFQIGGRYNFPASDLGTNSQTEYLYYANRPLSQGEISAIAAAPYSIFLPHPALRYITAIPTLMVSTINVSDSAVGDDQGRAGLLAGFSDAATASDSVAVLIGRVSIAAGTTGTVASAGSSSAAPLAGSWQIFLGSSSIADSFVASGWNVSYSAGTFTITVPPGTTPSIGLANYFTAYYQSVPGAAPLYCSFDTTPDTGVIKSMTDSAVGADSAAGTGRIVTVSDSAVSSDTQGMAATIGVTDAGVGSESPIGPSQGINVADSAVSTDTQVVGGFLAEAHEMGIGFETTEVNASGAVTDNAYGQSIGVAISISSASASIPVADAGVGTDTMDFAASPIIAVTDTATGTDTATVPAQSGGSFAEALLN